MSDRQAPLEALDAKSPEGLSREEKLVWILGDLMNGVENYFGAENPKRLGHINSAAIRIIDEVLAPQEHFNEKLADIAIDLDKQFISAAGEIASLRLALITMSMLDADSEQLKETAQRILDRSRERWPPEHKPFTSIAILKDDERT